MVRVAIVSDIHGNLPALEAVLRDLEVVRPDRVIVNGDVVNRGPQSKECLDRVRALGWPIVFGNHEDYVLKCRQWADDRDWGHSAWSLVRKLAQEVMTNADMAYMQSLPRTMVIEEPGLPSVRLVHGSMRALNDGLGYWLSDDGLLAAVEGAPEPVIIGAHTHRTFERRVGDKWILNSGSVGFPYNGNPHAQYLLLTGHDGEWQATFREVVYDRQDVYAAWEETGDLEVSGLSNIMKFELETATYHVGPYIDFCERHGLEIDDVVAFQRYRESARDVPPGRSLRGALDAC